MIAFKLLLLVHIGAGLAALIVFWVAVFSRNGGALHIFSGKSFAYCTYVVVATGLGRFAGHLLLPEYVTAKPSDMAFYLFFSYLAVVTLASVRQGIRVIQTRSAPAALRTPFHIALNALALFSGVAMIALAWNTQQVLFAAMAPIGILLGWANLKYIRTPPSEPMAWWYEHMGAMIGGGIAMHTAFLVFGLPRLSGIQLEGPVAIVPFVLPTVIGVPAIRIWVGYYRRKFAAPQVKVVTNGAPLL
jgi:hypothetical protein